MSLVLSESLVLAKTRSQDLKSVLKLNCWGSGIKDVSLVRQMINVEVIGLSCNEVSTLEDFAHCPKLRELILRKNNIKNIAEVAHLQGLPKLTSLWLGENPCAENTHNYRKVVLKALPNLTVLDNQPVTREELQEIEELGNEIYEEIPYDSVNSSSSGHSSAAAAGTTRSSHHHHQQADTNHQQETQLQEQHDFNNGNEHYQSNNNSIDTSHYQQPNEIMSTPATASVAQHDVSSMSQHHGNLTNQLNDSNYTTASHNNNNNNSKTPLRSTRCLSNQGSTSMGSQFAGWSSSNNNLLPKGGKSRNANILSAVLCLVKELDYVSCEVVQTALHCRMEETLL